MEAENAILRGSGPVDEWTAEALDQYIINENNRINEINRQIGVLMSDRSAHEQKVSALREAKGDFNGSILSVKRLVCANGETFEYRLMMGDTTLYTTWSTASPIVATQFLLRRFLEHPVNDGV